MGNGNSKDSLCDRTRILHIKYVPPRTHHCHYHQVISHLPTLERYNKRTNVVRGKTRSGSLNLNLNQLLSPLFLSSPVPSLPEGAFIIGMGYRRREKRSQKERRGDREAWKEGRKDGRKERRKEERGDKGKTGREQTCMKMGNSKRLC